VLLASTGVLAADAKGVVEGVVAPDETETDADGCEPSPDGTAAGS
jgi:hypothetical protein